MRLPPLKALSAFESVARNKSVAAAAEELALTPSAVSHQIAGLEEILGRPLFIREGRGLKITPVGERYLAEITNVLADLGRATDDAAKESDIQILRLHSVPSFGLLWLLPRLCSFSADRPDFEIKIACSYEEEVSFLSGRYDIAIRYGVPNWPGVKIHSMRGECVMPLASPGYLKSAPVTAPEDILQRRLISSETHLVQWPQWFNRYGIEFGRKTYDLSFDRSYMALEAASLGMGVVLESNVLAEQYLRDGRLTPVLAGDHQVEILGHHVVYPSNTRVVKRIREFVDWLAAESGGKFAS